MSADAWIILAALIVALSLLTIACGGNVSVARELRKANARNAFLAEQRDRLADVCEALTGELQENDHLAIGQARKSLAQQARIAELEARELPQLAEIRERRAAAHGSQWGPS